MSGFAYETNYFLREGRTNLEACLKATFEAARAHSISKVIIFTVAGAGVTLALDSFCTQREYEEIKLVAVTFPQATVFTVGDPSEHAIPAHVNERLAKANIPIVRAHLPFEPIRGHKDGRGLLGQDLSLIGDALGMFGGSMSLCVQAVLMACDAGHIDLGEHVLAMTSDTSVLIRAADTSRLLTDLIVREVICKPVLLTISRSEVQIEGDLSEERVELPSLGTSTTDDPDEDSPEP